MELLARKKLLRLKLHMDPLVIVDINFFVFHWVQLWFEPYLLFLHGFFKCCKIVSRMELLANKILSKLFLLKKILMNLRWIMNSSFEVIVMVLLLLEASYKNNDFLFSTILLLVRFICKNYLPFSIVEAESFRSLIKCHNHTAKVIHNKRLKSIISKMESEMRAMMIGKLKDQSLLITLDHWTSKGHDNYTGMTVHYIDEDWTLQPSDIGLFLHHGGTRAEELKDDFENVCGGRGETDSVEGYF